MMLKLSEQFEKVSNVVVASESEEEERDAVRNYMHRALVAYQKHTSNTDIYTGSEKTDTLIKFASLMNEAFKLHTEGVTPESEKAQKFIKAFWETLLEYTDGNMDLIQQMNEQLKRTENQDEATKISQAFIESALEVYFKNQTD